MAADVESVTRSILDQWATDPAGPVALHLKQRLLPVEGEGGIIFPPTYADIGYNIDTLADGTRVATIDSVGSQANRLEPIFKAPSESSRDQWLVPQIEIILRDDPCGECAACRAAQAENNQKGKKKAQCVKPHQVKRSILDLAHRSADAVVQSCPGLASLVAEAFQRLRRTGDASLLCEIAPTSLVFGVWDSRGDSGEKLPRLVRSIIRAWDVEPLYAAAQFNSIRKALSEEQWNELEKEAEAKPEIKPSKVGFDDAPATFRPVSTNAAKHMTEFRDGSPNPERRVLGGVLARGKIEREVTVNLVALRRLQGGGDAETGHLRKYLLGLALVAATEDIDLFLREGCHLRYADQDAWLKVPRRGEPSVFKLESSAETYAKSHAEHYQKKWGSQWSDGRNPIYKFESDEAKKLIRKAKKVKEKEKKTADAASDPE
jgi:CRISPR-associated protein Csb1